ncbi:MAG: homoserine dehydrogenase [Mycobacteriales bacterium]|nr:homoserine dehydrogenase [Frankia sp.]
MSTTTRPPVRLALLGCGVVGSDVVRLLAEHAEDLRERVGAPIEIAGIAVRTLDARRDVRAPVAVFTTDPAALAVRADIDVVVELIGGVEPARTLLLAALGAGKSVVTANKALLATHGPELHAAAEAAGTDLYFEAAVAGGIPILRPLRESLAGERLHRVTGIVNGTTNFILSRMTETATSYAAALEEAQALGYAEADPTADVDGSDAAAKAAILASIAFHTRVTAADVHREGIDGVTAADVASAAAFGRAIKLLAICERDGDAVSVRVHPAMLPSTHPLASVREAFNAVFVEGPAVGQLMFYGPGAGGPPTATAVLGDIVAVCRNRLAGQRGVGESAYAALRIRPMSETVTRYHVSLDVADKAGVLAAVAGAVAEHDVSIATVRQDGRGEDASLVFTTHAAPDGALAATVDDLRRLDVVRAVRGVMRVEGDAT